VAYEKRGARLRLPPPTRTRSAGGRLAQAAALALTAALAVAGCTSTTADTTAGSANTSSAPVLSQTQAKQAFDAYVAASNTAARTDDAKLALSVVTDAQQSLVSATLRGHGSVVPGTSNDSGQDVTGSGSFFGSRPSLRQYTYGTPTFYLPEPAGYPRFFLVGVTRTPKGVSAADGDIITRVGGAAVPVSGPALMVFEQSASAAPWRLASVSQFPSGTTLPRLATDKSGHIPQVSLTSPDLLAQPYATGPLQAAVVDEGPASAAAKVVASGPLTTGIYQEARTAVGSGLTAPAGDVYQWSMDGTPYPAFALRTADGGALILYAMYLNGTVAVPGYLDNADPIQPGAPIEVPLGLLPFLPSGQRAPRVELSAQDLLSFAAIDPPASPAKITVIAVGGGFNYATDS
jgi:hypothetical protein